MGKRCGPSPVDGRGGRGGDARGRGASESEQRRLPADAVVSRAELSDAAIDAGQELGGRLCRDSGLVPVLFGLGVGVPVVWLTGRRLSRKKPEARLSSLTGGHGGPSVDLEKRSPKAKGRADERTEWGWIEGLGGQVAFAEEEEEAGGDLGRVDCCTQEKTRGGKGEEGRIRSTTRVKRAIATSPSPASYFG